MVPPELLEVGRIFGLIVAFWFALLGWKLVPLVRSRKPARAKPLAPRSA